VGGTKSVWMFRKREKYIFPPTGIRTQDRPASSLVSIPTMLHRFIVIVIIIIGTVRTGQVSVAAVYLARIRLLFSLSVNAVSMSFVFYVYRPTFQNINTTHFLSDCSYVLKIMFNYLQLPTY
jgi:hypothetical protein